MPKNRFLFDDYPIELGDVLYDFNHGSMVVAELAENKYILKVYGPTGRRVVYSPRGVEARRTRKTLFWQPPVVATPPKDKEEWARHRVILKAMMEAVHAAYATAPTEFPSVVDIADFQ